MPKNVLQRNCFRVSGAGANFACVPLMRVIEPQIRPLRFKHVHALASRIASKCAALSSRVDTHRGVYIYLFINIVLVMLGF